MSLLIVEMRRDLYRRLTAVLIAMAVGAVVVVGIAVFAANEPFGYDPTAAEALRPPGDDPRYLTALWPRHSPGDALLLTPAIFLTLFAFVAGASMIGAEWKAGTFTNLLTWEPRRTRVMAAKLGAAGLLAGAISAALLAVFSAAFLPTVLAKGTTAGADAAWLGGLTAGVLRIAGIAGLAAVAGAAVAAIGRNTAGAIGAVFGYIALIEPLVRGLRPRLQPWLVVENAVVWLTGGRAAELPIDRTAAEAGLTLAAYAVALSLVAWFLFIRRDVAGGA